MKKRIFSIVFVLAFVLLFAVAARADVISVNSGGNVNLIITPDKYIEGFFSQIPNPPVIPVTPPVTPPSGGGGGGGGGAATTTQNIVVSPAEINLDMTVNSSLKRTITITNFGSTSTTVSLSQSKLDGIAFLGNGSLNSVTIGPGETYSLEVTFAAPSKAGNYAGTINIGDKQVLVSINVKTVSLLFDSHIVVLNPSYTVSQGDDLRTQVTLIPMSNAAVRTDVTLNYEIKDYNGTVYQKRSETILVTSLTTLNRNFNTNSLPPGNYVVSLELVYSNGVAPSSAQFLVTPKTPFQRILGYLVFFLIILILAIGVLIIIIFIIRVIKRNRIQREYLKRHSKVNGESNY